MIVNALFLFGCFLLDEIVMILFPNNFAMPDLLFMSNIGFCALVLTIKKFNLIDSLLLAMIFGMIYDVMFAQAFFTYIFIFVIIALLVRLWAKHMTDTLIESLIICIVAIFVKDLMVFELMSIRNITEIPFMLWAQRYELLTLFMNTIFVIILVFFVRIKEDYLLYRAVQLRKGEKVEWFRLK